MIRPYVLPVSLFASWPLLAAGVAPETRLMDNLRVGKRRKVLFVTLDV
jgi:hypothetical protein